MTFAEFLARCSAMACAAIVAWGVVQLFMSNTPETVDMVAQLPRLAQALYLTGAIAVTIGGFLLLIALVCVATIGTHWGAEN